MPGLYTGAAGLWGGFSGLLFGTSLSTPPGLLADAGGFSPASLFVNGEQGVWYDPSDLPTLFQDSAGTTPVTAVEQPVGLILDKRGSLVSYNPATMTISSYDGGGATTIVRNGANLTFTSAAISDGIRFNAITTADNYSVIEFIASGSGSLLVYAGGTPLPVTLTGTPTAYRAATQPNSAAFTIFRSNSAGLSASITINSVYAIRGNHASQSTSASRPVLSARYNLLTQTEDFLTGWAQNGLVTTGMTNVTTAPNGTQTADQLVESDTTGTHIDYRSVSGSKADTISVAARANTRSVLTIGCNDNTSGNWSAAAFNLSAGTAATAQSAGTFSGISSITPLGSGWYRCTLSVTSSGNAVGQIKFGVSDTTTPTFGSWADYSYDGDGTSGIYIWGADLRVTNDGVGLPAYQRVGAATYGVTNPSVVIGNPDYDTTGFPLYLKFDGTDDGLSTASIDFTSTDEMSVFGGLRKLSDVNVAVVAELGVIYFAVNGSFVVAAPGSVAPTGYEAAAKGTVNSGIGASDPAPTTDVLTAPIKISTDQLVLRNNGVQVAQSTLDLGGGNFGNHPLYIGRRGDTTLPYNGRIYSLIVRGAQSTATEITNTETWVNSKTGAF